MKNNKEKRGQTPITLQFQAITRINPFGNLHLKLLNFVGDDTTSR